MRKKPHVGGDTEAASAYYRRFHDFWKEGDIDRTRVDETRSKLAAMTADRR